jgi:hypothetical protein
VALARVYTTPIEGPSHPAAGSCGYFPYRTGVAAIHRTLQARAVGSAGVLRVDCARSAGAPAQPRLGDRRSHLGTALDIMSSGAETRDPGIVSPSAFIFSSSRLDECDETADQRNEGTRGKKFGFSFSWRRAHGVSTAKRKMSNAIGGLLILP